MTKKVHVAKRDCFVGGGAQLSQSDISLSVFVLFVPLNMRLHRSVLLVFGVSTGDSWIEHT